MATILAGLAQCATCCNDGNYHIFASCHGSKCTVETKSTANENGTTWESFLFKNNNILLVITQGLTGQQIIVTSHIAHGVQHENTNIQTHKADKKGQQQG